MPAGEELTKPNPAPALLTVSVCGGPALNCAVTCRGACMLSVHTPVPVQSPLQPAKEEPEAGVAVSVTLLPSAKVALHVGPQLIPPTELLTVPLPEPLLLTESDIAEESVGLNHQSTPGGGSKLATPLKMKRLLPLPLKENWQ